MTPNHSVWLPLGIPSVHNKSEFIDILRLFCEYNVQSLEHNTCEMVPSIPLVTGNYILIVFTGNHLLILSSFLLSLAQMLSVLLVYTSIKECGCLTFPPILYNLSFWALVIFHTTFGGDFSSTPKNLSGFHSISLHLLHLLHCTPSLLAAWAFLLLKHRIDVGALASYPGGGERVWYTCYPN